MFIKSVSVSKAIDDYFTGIDFGGGCLCFIAYPKYGIPSNLIPTPLQLYRQGMGSETGHGQIKYCSGHLKSVSLYYV
jgi:hypothetical protein